jgi:hypothetical protein
LVGTPRRRHDQEFVKGLYAKLDEDLRTGEVYPNDERLIPHGRTVW